MKVDLIQSEQIPSESSKYGLEILVFLAQIDIFFISKLKKQHWIQILLSSLIEFISNQ